MNNDNSILHPLLPWRNFAIRSTHFRAFEVLTEEIPRELTPQEVSEKSTYTQRMKLAGLAFNVEVTDAPRSQIGLETCTVEITSSTYPDSHFFLQLIRLRRYKRWATWQRPTGYTGTVTSKTCRKWLTFKLIREGQGALDRILAEADRERHNDTNAIPMERAFPTILTGPSQLRAIRSTFQETFPTFDINRLAMVRGAALDTEGSGRPQNVPFSIISIALQFDDPEGYLVGTMYAEAVDPRISPDPVAHLQAILAFVTNVATQHNPNFRWYSYGGEEAAVLDTFDIQPYVCARFLRPSVSLRLALTLTRAATQDDPTPYQKSDGNLDFWVNWTNGPRATRRRGATNVPLANDIHGTMQYFRQPSLNGCLAMCEADALATLEIGVYLQPRLPP